MKRWKKNLVAGAVLMTVCAGIYVNWLYTEEQSVANLTDTLNSDKLLSSDLMVMGEDAGADNLNSETTVTDYFAAVRLSRQQARDSAVGLLQEAMAYSDTAENTQNNAKLESIVGTALCEAQIESLVIAKGYTDCVAYISDDGISVAVAAPEGGLVQKDVAVIADIVMTQSEYGLENIRVVEVQ
ncbi:MAG: SpoIIIAH-like family protein [Oscillospiraceae bacterium]|nr:SpoIIIAH-like family protein [Oscillospiraceae bacterium]